MCDAIEKDKMIEQLVSKEIRRLRGEISNRVRYIRAEKECSPSSRLKLDRVKSVISGYESEIANMKNKIEILEC